MEKEFVSYELAVKLKELGFNEKCFMAYYKLLRHEFYDFRSASNIIFNEDNPIKLLNYAGGDFRVKECDAPLWQQAFDWFRDIKGLPASIGLTIDNKGYTFLITNLGKIPKVDHLTFPDKLDYGTYEQARNACLEKLIQLIQNKNDRSI